MISLYFPKGDIKSQFINDRPYVKGESGRMATYLTPYIQLIYILYRLFEWGKSYPAEQTRWLKLILPRLTGYAGGFIRL